MNGKLIVFEGADGVGKSDLSLRFFASIESQGHPCMFVSFPGKEEGTLGKLVYDFHANPKDFGVEEFSAASLQALHIAAHIDAIERRILPALSSGRSVLMDRYWWSTHVYGLVGGVNTKLLASMIETEKAAWGAVKPDILFLIDRSQPLRPEPINDWQLWRVAYLELLSSEKGQYLCEVVANEGDIGQTQNSLLEIWNARSGFGTS